jgi:hypothetical protein
MLMHDSFTETGYGAKSKVYTDIFSGATLYVTATWGLNATGVALADPFGAAGDFSLYTCITFSYSYSVNVSGDYTLNYNIILNNDAISNVVHSYTDFHIKVFVR